MERPTCRDTACDIGDGDSTPASAQEAQIDEAPFLNYTLFLLLSKDSPVLALIGRQTIGPFPEQRPGQGLEHMAGSESTSDDKGTGSRNCAWVKLDSEEGFELRMNAPVIAMVALVGGLEPALPGPTRSFKLGLAPAGLLMPLALGNKRGRGIIAGRQLSGRLHSLWAEKAGGRVWGALRFRSCGPRAGSPGRTQISHCWLVGH